MKNYLIVILSFAGAGIYASASISTSGLELSTVIFLFIYGSNAFKSQFYFTQGNNISRKSFLKGTVMGGLAISLILPIIDIVINRFYNLLTPSPMNYDMIYGSARDIIISQEMYFFTTDNGIMTLLETYVFTAAIYIFVFILGLFITMLMFKLSKIGKSILWGSIAVLFVYSNLVSLVPNRFWLFFQNAFGWNTRNPYMGVLSLSILSIVFILGQYLLIRRAEANKL